MFSTTPIPHDDPSAASLAVPSGVDWELGLVLDSVLGDAFLRRRAEAVVGELEDPTERALLRRVVEAVAEGGSPPPVVGALLSLCGYLETRERLDEAVAVIETARNLVPEDAAIVLHAARVHRRLGNLDAAAEGYARVRGMDVAEGSLWQMARIGEALICPSPVAALGTAMWEARGRGEIEASALAQAERARFRRLRGHRDAAARDYLGAAFRFPDPIDRGRAGHECADMLIAAGQPEAARAVLMITLDLGHPIQADWARARLHTLSRALGDEVGRRRWAGSSHPELASLTLRGPRARAEASRPLARFLDRLAGIRAGRGANC